MQDNNVQKLSWFLDHEPDVLASVEGIHFTSIRHNLSWYPKIPLLCTFPDGTQESLYLPQNVPSFYPVILQKSPKIVIHGRINLATLACEYVVISSKPKVPITFKVGAKKVAWAIFGLGFFPLLRRLSRVCPRPFKTTRDIFSDLKEQWQFTKLKRDNSDEQIAIESMSDIEIKGCMIKYAIRSVLSLLSALVSYLLLMRYGNSPFMASVIALLLVFVAILCLHARYVFKCRRGINVFVYLWRFITLRGL